LTTEVKAGAVRQANVENDQMRLVLAGIAHPFSTRHFPGDQVAITAKAVLQATRYSRVIFNEQNAGSLVHDLTYSYCLSASVTLALAAARGGRRWRRQRGCVVAATKEVMSHE
jgi:hypothetical protein